MHAIVALLVVINHIPRLNSQYILVLQAKCKIGMIKLCTKQLVVDINYQDQDRN